MHENPNFRADAHPVREFRDAIDREIAGERERQEKKFGQQNWDPFKYLAILGEEVGEANKAAIEAYDFRERVFDRDQLAREYRDELIQVAAVAKAMIECIDRGIWT